MRRRRFLSVLAGGAAATVAGCAPANGDAATEIVTDSGGSAPDSPASTTRPKPARVSIAAGPLTALPPTAGLNLALTVDDGTDPDVVGAYIRFAQGTGARFTFFVTACYDSWRIHRAELRPLVDSGQIQLGNHTWDHPDLTKLSASAVASQLERTKTFLRDNFGVDGTPFYRPPYGYHNATVNRVAADLGYAVPTLWYGSLSDSGPITEQYLVECARKYFQPNAIVIGHANRPPVTHVYDQLVDIIRERGLTMVTLDDVVTVRIG